MISQYLNHWLDCLFPRQCLLCDRVLECDVDFCQDCFEQLPWTVERCYQCGISISYPMEAVYCVSCREHPPHFDRVCALFDYIDPVKSMIAKFKYGGKLYYGKAFGELMARSLKDRWYSPQDYPDFIICVPMTWEKLRKREFNQAYEIALTVKKQLKLKLDLKLCSKIRETSSQVKLTRSEREKNMLKCFVIHRSIKDQHIALIDDVMTTGSTVGAISQLLKAAGACQVDVWCVARA